MLPTPKKFTGQRGGVGVLHTLFLLLLQKDTLFLILLPKEEIAVVDEVLLRHVRQLTGQILGRGILLFVNLRIHSYVLGIVIYVVTLAARCMILPMKSIHQKTCIFEENWVPVQAICVKGYTQSRRSPSTVLSSIASSRW